MGDTFDDWLVDKIQLLRKGRIIAFAVKRVEQVSLRLYLQLKRGGGGGGGGVNARGQGGGE